MCSFLYGFSRELEFSFSSELAPLAQVCWDEFWKNLIFFQHYSPVLAGVLPSAVQDSSLCQVRTETRTGNVSDKSHTWESRSYLYFWNDCLGQQNYLSSGLTWTAKS